MNISYIKKYDDLTNLTLTISDLLLLTQNAVQLMGVQTHILKSVNSGGQILKSSQKYM